MNAKYVVFYTLFRRLWLSIKRFKQRTTSFFQWDKKNFHLFKSGRKTFYDNLKNAQNWLIVRKSENTCLTKNVFFFAHRDAANPATLLLLQNITYCFWATMKQPVIGRQSFKWWGFYTSPVSNRSSRKLSPPCSSAAWDAAVGWCRWKDKGRSSFVTGWGRPVAPPPRHLSNEPGVWILYLL